MAPFLPTGCLEGSLGSKGEGECRNLRLRWQGGIIGLVGDQGSTDCGGGGGAHLRFPALDLFIQSTELET